jgi:peptide chain release factor 1
MKDRLEAIRHRYLELQDALSQPDIASNIERMTSLARELSGLEPIVETYKTYEEALSTLQDLKDLSKDEDPEMRAYTLEEIPEVKKQIETLEETLKILLVPKDPNDEKNVIMEIRGAAGGDEANIFAGDLFRMYTRYFEVKGYKYTIIHAVDNEAGGFSQIELSIQGDGPYKYLKYESGAHRVQRVPQTESQGRVHTSTATVLVLPEAEAIDFELDMSELRIDTYRSSGSGGQSVNTTDSAVRVTHEPTGIVVTCQDGKSQHENKATAIKVMRSRLYDHIEQERLAKEGLERRSKLGSGDRSEKIRTYNYPQNRVTDHRIGFTIQQLDRVMEGKLEPVIEALIDEELKRKLSTTE